MADDAIKGSPLAQIPYQEYKKQMGTPGANLPGAPTTDLDQGTKDLIASKQARAGRDLGSFESEQLAGTGSAGALQTPDEQYQRQAASLGMQDDVGLRQALQNRSQESFGRTLEGLSQQAKAEAPARRYNELAGAFGSQMNVERINAMNHKKSVLADINKQAMKNQVLSNVFGMVGSIVGGIFGGPGGAQAGGQVGGSVMNGKDTEEM